MTYLWMVVILLVLIHQIVPFEPSDISLCSRVSKTYARRMAMERIRPPCSEYDPKPQVFHLCDMIESGHHDTSCLSLHLAIKRPRPPPNRADAWSPRRKTFSSDLREVAGRARSSSSTYM